MGPAEPYAQANEVKPFQLYLTRSKLVYIKSGLELHLHLHNKVTNEFTH